MFFRGVAQPPTSNRVYLNLLEGNQSYQWIGLVSPHCSSRLGPWLYLCIMHINHLYILFWLIILICCYLSIYIYIYISLGTYIQETSTCIGLSPSIHGCFLIRLPIQEPIWEYIDGISLDAENLPTVIRNVQDMSLMSIQNDAMCRGAALRDAWHHRFFWFFWGQLKNGAIITGGFSGNTPNNHWVFHGVFHCFHSPFLAEMTVSATNGFAHLRGSDAMEMTISCQQLIACDR